MNAIVASSKILGQRPGEEPFEIYLQIGTPYQVGTDPEEWACPVALSPLYSRLHDAHGGSSFQALYLASSLALDLLHGFTEKGGSLSFSPGQAFAFEAYSFGIANRGSGA